MSETESLKPDLSSSKHASSVRDERAISAELLSAFMSLMPDAAVVVDTNGRIVSVNQEAEALFGYPLGSLTGLSVEALVPERLRPRHRQHRSTYLAATQKRPMGAALELTGRRRDGQEFPLDISLAPIMSSGDEQLVVAAVRDITEKKAATAAQAELAAIVGSSLDAIISTSLEGHVTSWNPAAEHLLGYSRDEIIGKHIATLVPGDASIVVEELLDFAYEGVHSSARDTRWRHRGGYEVDVAVSISPLRDPSETVLGFASIVRDVSEQKRAERELRRLLAEEAHLQRQHAAASDIRLALLSGASLHESLALICERAAEHLDAPVAVICVKNGDDVRIAAAVGPAADLVGMSLPAGSSFAERVIDSGEHAQLERRTADSSVELPLTVPDGPTLGVPVIAGGAANASLTCVREPGGTEFNNADRIFAETLATQAALAFEFDRARRDREEIVIAGDRERIARDLHDLVIQRLFATGMGLQSTLAFIGTPREHERVSEAIDSLDETIRELRNAIFGLSSPLLSNEQFKRRIVELARLAQKTLGFEPSVRFEGPVDLGIPDGVVPDVLAVVREGLSNVARHARAGAVKVEVNLTGDTLLVAVTDDGVGMTTPTRSSGLANLEERARLLGGGLDVVLPTGGGCRLEWRVPVRS